jgi:CBS domain containing-hemolysin-like protein
MPAVGETVELNRLRFEVVALSEYRIELVRITKVEPHDEEHQ